MTERVTLNTLPVELLYSIHLFSSSEHLPYVSKRLFSIFSQTSPLYRAEYLVERYFRAHANANANGTEVQPPPSGAATTNLSPSRLHERAAPRNIVTFALQYPLCNEPTLKALLRLEVCPEIDQTDTVLLPRRLFKQLVSEDREPGKVYTKQDHPLPFLRYLYHRPPWIEKKVVENDRTSRTTSSRTFTAPSANSHQGYPLVRAVHVGHIPLIQFLLAHNASPTCKKNLALRVAIRKQNLKLVRLLIERDESSEGIKNANGKRRRLEDRMEVPVDMLKAAVDVGAKDIVNYFMDEKGVRPDMETLKTMEKRGFFD